MSQPGFSSQGSNSYLCRRLKEQEKKVKSVDEREVMIDDTGTNIETNIEGYVSYMNTFNVYSFPFEDKTNGIGTRLE